MVCSLIIVDIQSSSSIIMCVCYTLYVNSKYLGESSLIHLMELILFRRAINKV